MSGWDIQFFNVCFGSRTAHISDRRWRTDIMFTTSAARKAFIVFLSYFHSQDDTTLSLPKADARYTTSALIAYLPDQMGGSQTDVYVDSFSLLLPVYLRSIATTLMYVMEKICPEDLLLYEENYSVESDATPEIWTSTHFKMSSNERIMTHLVYIPSKRFYYL